MTSKVLSIALLISLSSGQPSPTPTPTFVGSSLSLLPSAGGSYSELEPDSKCLEARAIDLDVPLSLTMDQSFTDNTLLCNDGGPWFSVDYYKSEYIKVRGTGGVLQVSTCNSGSSVDTRVTIYSRCLDTKSCQFASVVGCPLGYDDVCNQACVATSSETCGDEGTGSQVSWSTVEGTWYYIQVWQNRRSWGTTHQLYYTPVPCPGTAVVTVKNPNLRRSVKALAKTSLGGTAMNRLYDDRNNKRNLYRSFDYLDSLYWNGHEELSTGQSLTSSTRTQPEVFYGNSFDPFCPATVDAPLPGTWFSVITYDYRGPRIVCLSGSAALESASIFIVGQILDLDFQYEGCVPDAEPISMDGCVAATKFFYAGGEYAILVQTKEPVDSFNAALLEVQDECASSSSPSLSPSVQPTSVERPTNCGELQGCFLENLDTGDELELQDSLVYEPSNFSYSVRCDVAGSDLNRMDFFYDNEVHTERLEPWYLNGNSGKKVNKESYLGSCGEKTIAVVGSVADGACFESTFSFQATGC